MNKSEKFTKKFSIFAIMTLMFCASIFIIPATADITESKTIVDDQGSSFWSVYRNGTGPLSVAISDDTSIKQSGESSLKQVISTGTYETVGFYHRYESTVDWSAYHGITFWVYGSKSNGYINFLVFDDKGKDYLYIVTDNFSGWKQFTLDFATSFKTGDVNLTSIALVEFAFSDPAPTQVNVDKIVLFNYSPGDNNFPIFPWSNTTSGSPTPTPTVTMDPHQSTSPAPTSDDVLESFWTSSMALVIVGIVIFVIAIVVVVLVLGKRKKP